MGQVRVKENVYFQTYGEHEVEGVYVNEPFIKVYVAKKPTDDELQELGNKLYEICMSIESIKSVVDTYEELYKKDPCWDHNGPSPFKG